MSEKTPMTFWKTPNDYILHTSNKGYFGNFQNMDFSLLLTPVSDTAVSFFLGSTTTTTTITTNKPTDPEKGPAACARAIK